MTVVTIIPRAHAERASWIRESDVPVRRWLNNPTLRVQMMALAMTAVVLTAGAVLTIVSLFASAKDPSTNLLRLSLVIAVVVLSFVIVVLIDAWLKRILSPLDQLRSEQAAHEQSKRILSARSETVDRLLEFSQTIQGAGKADQIFATLAHFLQTELKLTGLVIFARDADAIPSVHLKVASPADLMRPDRLLSEMDISLCPCLRQSLPRLFKPDSPVRCAIDQFISLDASHPAYCIPFNIGRQVQVLVHMLLAPGLEWTEEIRQLAQTYVNTANSTLVSLHLLSEAEKQSMTDGLTGLYNRRSLDQLMQREVALSERHGHPLSLVMIDMDKFKEINDAHGHAAGDYMLKAFADCVRITLRKTDLAFRYGGDEFVIALPQTHVGQAQQVVQKLRTAFASVDFTDAIAHLEHQPTLSIGVAERSAQQNVLNLASLLSAADQALYDAKNNNRNCVRVYSPIKAA